MIPVWLFIAWRYIYNSHAHNSVKTLAKLSCISIAVGTFSLALITSVMSGFEKTTHQKFQAVHSDIIMHQYGESLNADAIESVISKEFPEIISISPVSTQQCSIVNTAYDKTSSIIGLKGIQPKKELSTTQLISSIITPKQADITKTFDEHSLVIGHKLAEALSITVGDIVTVLYTQDLFNGSHTINLEQKNVKIGGIFRSGVEEYDETIAYCDWKLFTKLFPESGIQTLHIKRNSHVNETMLINKLKERFSLAVYSWKELYPSLISALILEKYAMTLIVSLVLLMACLSIISLIYMQLHIKQTDCAILMTAGMKKRDIQKIFLSLSGLLGLIGATFGISLATITGTILQRCSFITLPDSYYTSTIPVAMNFTVFVSIFIITLLLCCGVTLLPLQRISSLSVASILKSK